MKSNVVGVTWHKPSSKWQVHIQIKGRLSYVGSFDDFDEAVMARYKAEQRHCKSSAQQYLEDHNQIEIEKEHQ